MAAVALLSWPVVALCFCLALGAARGLIWSVIIGALFLPENYSYDLPILTDYSKFTAVSYGSLIALLYAPASTAPRGTLERRLLPFLLIALSVMPIGTWLTNTDHVFQGIFRRGLSLQDGVSEAVDSFVMILPVLVALRVLDRREHLDEILRALALSAAVYSLLILFELRMSPQLHNMVYGYFPHSWIQHLRGGGYRPLVFMAHGLALGFYLLSACLAAFALYRQSRSGLWLVTGLWLFVLLFLSRNVGAAILAVLLVPVILFLSARVHVFIASAMMAIFLAYPFFHDTMSGGFATIVQSLPGVPAARVDSLIFRLENEGILLDRAQERPLFGWGGYGRNRVFLDNGRDISITDGDWIVRLGKYGWLGFVTQYGVVFLAVLAAWRRRAALRAGTLTGFMLIVASLLAYNIPNVVWPLYVLIGLGAVINAVARTTEPDPAPGQSEQPGRGRNLYTRFGDPVSGASEAQPAARQGRRPVVPTQRPARAAHSRQG